MLKSAKACLLLSMLCFTGSNASAYDLNVNLLTNPGFEDALGTSPPPDWLHDWTPTESGMNSNVNAVRTGSYGLWAYTAETDVDAFVELSQSFTARPGDVFQGNAWFRTPASDGSRDSGSSALVAVEFFDEANRSLARNTSLLFDLESNEFWSQYTVSTEPAPSGTARVEYSCLLSRPGWGTGQSVLNIDDCSFTLTGQNQGLAVFTTSPNAVGIARNVTTTDFILKNQSTQTLAWNAQASVAWISSITPASGTLDSGAEISISLTVDRSDLTEESYRGQIEISSGLELEVVNVFMDMDAGYAAIPSMPSVMTIDGYRLLVEKRLTDNSLDTVRPWVIKGAAWSPASIGMSADKTERRDAFQQWYLADIGLLKEMNATTVYTFLDFGTTSEGLAVLDALYKQGIMAIITVDNDGNDDHATITEVVTAYKDHPAVLMWAIGNEWNINYFHGKYGDPDAPDTAMLQAAAEANENAAQLVKSLDPFHPVASIMGEISMDNRQPLFPESGLLSTWEIVNTICPSVDIWGANIYRGDNFGTLFDQWQSVSDKPFFLSEFGTDSYYTINDQQPITGYPSEPDQADFLNSLLSELLYTISAYDPDQVCLGGTVFEWNDEWWKIPAPEGNDDQQDNGGFSTGTWNPSAHPDGFANEEYFGVVDINRHPKLAYTVLQGQYGWDLNFSPVVLGIPDQTIEKGGSFAPVILDDYGSDVEDNDALLQWAYSGNNELLVSIDSNRMAVVTPPSPEWLGSESITFRVTDSSGVYDEEEVIFTVSEPKSNLLLLVLPAIFRSR